MRLRHECQHGLADDVQRTEEHQRLANPVGLVDDAGRLDRRR